MRRRRWRQVMAGAAVMSAVLAGLGFLIGDVGGIARSGDGSRPSRVDLARTGASAKTGTQKGTAAGTRSGIRMYRGLGSWVDIYDRDAYKHPEAVVSEMASRGVRTLYVETSNFNRRRAFVFEGSTERLLDAAHAAGLRVVAWYLPGFRNVDRDFRRIRRAISLTTRAGERFDSFALDIEWPGVPPALRTERLLELTARIRDLVGEGYPLGAIVPSPRGMRKHPSYWPGFPWRELHWAYDVFLPMTYFTWRVEGPAGARAYSAGNIRIVRDRTGDQTVPIHIIGGISDEATTAETRGFVRAVVERNVIGASYYGFMGTTDAQWAELARVPSPP